MSIELITRINEVGANNLSSPSRNCLLLGKRIVGFGDDDTKILNYDRLYLANTGYNQPNYIEPIQLPAFSDGKSVLDYMKNLGFRVKYGQNNELKLTAPDTIIPNGSVTTLTFNNTPPAFSLLVSANAKGKITQNVSSSNAVVTGTILNVIYNTINGQTVGQIIISSVTGGTFSTTGNVTITSAINLTFPDPNGTDPIAMMAYWFYQTSLMLPQNIDGSPSAYISVLPQNASSITYSTTKAIAMNSPNSVTKIDDKTYDLLYDFETIGTSKIQIDENGNRYIKLKGAGLLPLSYINDNCKVIQNAITTNSKIEETSKSKKQSVTVANASGIYNGYSLNFIANQLIIHVINTNGSVFDTALAITISTTASPQNALQYLKGIDIRCVIPQYEITSKDYTQTHKDLFDELTVLNNGTQSLENHFLTFAVCGNISTLPPQMTNLGLTFNNPTYIFPQYPYLASFGDIQLNGSDENTKVGGASVACQVAYCIANQDLTSVNNEKSSIMGIELNLPVCSSANKPNFSYNQAWSKIAIEQGLLTLSPANTGNVVIDNSVTNQVYLPNTNVRSVEFQQAFVWSTVYLLRVVTAQVVITAITKTDNSGTKVISDKLLKDIQSALISEFQQLNNVGLLMNVALYASKITVYRNPNDPTIILIDAPAQIVPSLTAVLATINLYSASYNFNTQGA
jgi:hypothetical protein